MQLLDVSSTKHGTALRYEVIVEERPLDLVSVHSR